jgi:hypothetical protein
MGITYVEMEKKPNILKGVESILNCKNNESFISDKDILYLEDESIRIKVKFTNESSVSKIKSHDFVSGLPIVLM